MRLPVATRGAHPLFDITEALREARIGAAHASLGVEAQVAAEVREREQQIAHLGGHGFLVARLRRERRVELRELLADLVANTGDLGPIEAHGRGALAELRRAA